MKISKGKQRETRKPFEVNNANKQREKNRDLFQKIGGTKGTFHAKMGTIQDRNSKDITEAEDIKKSGQEYTEKLF